MKRHIIHSSTLLLLILFIGCSNSKQVGKVVRIDPSEIKDSDANYGSEDLHIFISSMIQSLLRSNIVSSSTPYMMFDNISIAKNMNEHIDTKLIINSIRNHLIKTTKIHFLDHDYVKKSKSTITVDYLLTGDIHAIKKDTLHNIDNFYLLNLRVIDPKTSLIVWTEEKEIRKVLSK